MPSTLTSGHMQSDVPMRPETLACEHTAHSALGGTLQGVSRRSPGRSRPQELGRYGRTRQRYGRSASLRGEYEKFLIPQTPSDVISTYPLVTQQGVSGGDEDADQHYVPAAQLCSPRARGAEGASTRVVLLQLRLGI
jgi:hypothetical protein